MRLSKITANQTESSRLEQRSVIRCLVAEKYKQYEIYKRMYNVYREKIFVKERMYTNGINMGFPLQAWVVMIVDEVETHWLSSKEISSVLSG